MFLPSGYRVLWPLRVSRYRAVKVLVKYPGAVKFIAGSGAVRVCQAVLSCLGCRSKSKKCDKQLTHIVRVSISGQLLNCLMWVVKVHYGNQYCGPFSSFYQSLQLKCNILQNSYIRQGYKAQLLQFYQNSLRTF